MATSYRSWKRSLEVSKFWLRFEDLAESRGTDRDEVRRVVETGSRCRRRESDENAGGEGWTWDFRRSGRRTREEEFVNLAGNGGGLFSCGGQQRR